MKGLNKMKPDIKKKRMELNLTLEQVGDMVGVGKSTVRKWETGDIENMKRDKIVKLAKALRVSPAYIMGMEEENKPVNTIEVSSIPVLSKVSAGMPIYAEENIVDYIYLPATEVKPGKDVFGLIVSGDSMNKEFKEGDIVIIEKDSIVENGEIGVVLINGYNATLKQIKYVNDSIVLFPLSDNPAHDPQIYNDKDEVTIIGKVIGMHRKF